MLHTFVRRILFSIVPLAILAIDLWYSPFYYATSQTNKYASITALLKNQNLLLGSFAGHRIHVSIDDMRDPRFLSHLKTGKNAIVISAFIDDNGKVSGALLRAALERLNQVSPDDHLRLAETLNARNRLKPGQVLTVDLNIPSRHFAEFPLNHLYALIFEKGNSKEEDLAKWFKEIRNIAESQGVTTLIVPCLGTNWQSSNSIQFDDFFESIFDSLLATKNPRDIYLSLYSEWPTFEMEEAVASLNAAWNALFLKPPEMVIYHRDFRLIMLALFLCLLVSSSYAPPTLKNFLIISVAFTGVALGAGNTVDTLTQGYKPAINLTARILVLAILSIGFPVFVNWNPKDLFGKGGK